MKKKLNFFCILMLTLMAAQFIAAFVCYSGEMTEAFAEGYQDGRTGGTSTTVPTMNGFGAIAALIAGIGSLCSIVAFIRFILNVNRNKVFVWKNVSLLRWAGWGLLAYCVGGIAARVFARGNFTEAFLDHGDSLCSCVFYLIVAEVFAIGLKLKEEQDLTI
ncbi:MAG: DUF2975 domain-containing protein [Prevotella sp.]|nr:DUF2975 domain-containing protein [Prevotella sp.]